MSLRGVTSPHRHVGTLLHTPHDLPDELWDLDSACETVYHIDGLEEMGAPASMVVDTPRYYGIPHACAR